MTDDHGHVSLFFFVHCSYHNCVILFSFMTYYHIFTRVIRRAPLVKQKEFTFRGLLVLPGCLVDFVLFNVFCVLFCRSLFVLFYTFILINIFRYVFPNSPIIRNFLLFNSIWLSFLSLKVFIPVFD